MSRKKIIIVFLIFLFFIIGYFLIINNKSTSKMLKNYLIEHNFQNEDGLYVKQLSELNLDEYFENVDNGINSSYEKLYFDIDNYQLVKNTLNYYDGMSVFFSPMYDYKNSNLVYTKEINMNNNSIILEGDFNNTISKFNCSISNAENANLSDDDKQFLCDNTKEEVVAFFNEASYLIIDDKILKKIRN